MKTVSTLLLAALFAITLACGYSSKPTTPAVAGTAPTIAELAPATVNSGQPAFLLTVNGSNFASKASINWNGTAQVTTFVSATQVTANVAASSIASPATVAITVTNPGTAGTGAYGGGGTLAATSLPMSLTIN